ncbi:MAG: cysteine--tRNA ligase [Chloroflexi bacterium]|nr:MAG: cysteine--tRNA ligase [Chloroflexota bacterium]
MLWLYDTRRRGTFAFHPRTRTATMYVCGITPYDTTHLGHARTFVVFDVLARLLEARGHRVRYAQNVTDIDESILERAARDRVSWRDLGRREERAFLQDMRRLGWRRPDAIPHATREIRAMIELATRLRRRGNAYETQGGLYFDVSTFRRFGQLSRFSRPKMKRILAQQDDARLDDPARRSPVDFALWRRVTKGPTWPSPFGRGRPGWHLECSAMSDRHLGFPIDIHGGGRDLIYPHHESEIAQSEAAHGGRTRFVGHWVHIAPMRLRSKKMSKSDGMFSSGPRPRHSASISSMSTTAARSTTTMTASPAPASARRRWPICSAAGGWDRSRTTDRRTTSSGRSKTTCMPNARSATSSDTHAAISHRTPQLHFGRSRERCSGSSRGPLLFAA